MRNRIFAFITLLLLVVVSTGAEQARLTQEDVQTRMKCRENSRGDTECDYRVGRSLHFSIVGVGKPDASIYFYAASFEGDYFAVLGLSHGCVVVRPGKASGRSRQADLAFVSPRNGRVYSTWEACRDAA